MRQALQIADAMSPCILFMDELEKALAASAARATAASPRACSARC